MKKYALFLSLFIGLSVSMNGQLELKPMIGVTLNSLSDADDIDFNGKFDMHFGLDLMIGSQLYFQPGLHYVGTTTRFKPKGQISGDDVDVSVDRIEIPVLIGYRFGDPEENSLINLRVFTGPSLSFVANVDDDDSIFNISEADYNNITLGWNVGAGVDLLFLYADVGYQFGLSKIFDDLEVQGVNVENTTNNLFYINAGIRLRL